jgi:cytidylate kinase
MEKILAEISSRDRRDAERQASPLVAAKDAAIIDATQLSAEEVVKKILELARDKGLL